jgi:hypothetical protein
MNKWAEKVKQEIIDKYNSIGLKASGKFAEELETDVTETDTNLNIKFIGMDYTYYLVNGRSPGGFPPVQAIMDWIDDKGLIYDIKKESLAFLIGRKIARQGIPVPNEFNDGTLLEPIQENVDKLYNTIGEKVIEKVKTKIL